MKGITFWVTQIIIPDLGNQDRAQFLGSLPFWEDFDAALMRVMQVMQMFARARKGYSMHTNACYCIVII